MGRVVGGRRQGEEREGKEQGREGRRLSYGKHQITLFGKEGKRTDLIEPKAGFGLTVLL